jgi:hypothetical protein
MTKAQFMTVQSITLTQDEAEKIVTDFIADVRTYLMNRGIYL